MARKRKETEPAIVNSYARVTMVLDIPVDNAYHLQEVRVTAENNFVHDLLENDYDVIRTKVALITKQVPATVSE